METKTLEVDELRRYLATHSTEASARAANDVVGMASTRIGIGAGLAVAFAWIVGWLPTDAPRPFVALVGLLTSALAVAIGAAIAHGALWVYHRRLINGIARVILNEDPLYRRMELIVGAYDDYRNLEWEFNDWRHGVHVGYIAGDPEILARWNTILEPAREILDREILQINKILGAKKYAERRAHNAKSVKAPDTDLQGKLAELTGTPLDLPPLPNDPVPMPVLAHEESLRTLAEELRGHRARSPAIAQRT